MRRSLPKKGLSKDEILEKLKEYSKEDLDPSSGKLFTIAFESGIEEIRDVAFEAMKMFAFKNMLDFTEFPSMIKMEKDLVDVAVDLMHGDEKVTGTFTFGGTESVFLAVKAARDKFLLKKGFTIPEIVMPITAHPCYDKAAEYMGLKVKRVKVNEKYEACPEAINEALTENTAIIVGSAPNWPFGTVDPIEELAEIALDKKIWLHVDACVGGFVLPFMKKLGEKIPDFDFKIEGVCSISLDPHKYAYTPIGASILLFREKFYKIYSQFANLKWPGYPIVNPAVLSSRSEATLAAAWAVMNFLGEEGYLNLAKKILNARNKILKSLKEMDYKLMGEPSVILAFTGNLNLFKLCDEMAKRGWIFLPQRGIEGIAPSVHLTITPLHEMFVDPMLEDLKLVTEKIKDLPPSESEKVLEVFGMIMNLLAPGELDLSTIGKILEDIEKMAEIYGSKLLETFGLEKGFPKEMAMIYQFLNAFPPEIAELLVNYIVVEIFHRGF
ncbi:MAG: aspartate aminotransferase family protein [Archaeoglobaceae archaeon]|nr:aspartate aminotransferase family protein [Archaeoglobaceae archaeon]MCX8152526.1 aspartate aminotransferase family protein [Archaeoglobaceae archaeon]MDW8014053.1 aspartate aminotransferase family protein [Archaeoglobaceae archaeon]